MREAARVLQIKISSDREGELVIQMVFLDWLPRTQVCLEHLCCPMGVSDQVQDPLKPSAAEVQAQGMEETRNECLLNLLREHLHYNYNNNIDFAKQCT